MNHLTTTDRDHLEKASAWLHLGNHLEADKELDEIQHQLRASPEVLSVRWEIYAKAQKWDGALEIANTLTSIQAERVKSWSRRIQSLEQLGRTEDARSIIRHARESKTWPCDDLYELASEACRLDDFDEALECIKASIGKPGFSQLKAIALETPALQPIHAQIKNL